MTQHTAYLVLWIDIETLGQGRRGAVRHLTKAGIYSEATPSTGNGQYERPIAYLKATSTISYERAKSELQKCLLNEAHAWLHPLLDQTNVAWRAP